jgi:hypothetical protein
MAFAAPRRILTGDLLTAFEQYPNRPKHLAVHEWLDELIEPALKSF